MNLPLGHTSTHETFFVSLYLSKVKVIIKWAKKSWGILPEFEFGCASINDSGSHGDKMTTEGDRWDSWVSLQSGAVLANSTIDFMLFVLSWVGVCLAATGWLLLAIFNGGRAAGALAHHLFSWRDSGMERIWNQHSACGGSSYMSISKNYYIFSCRSSFPLVQLFERV